MAFIVTFMIIYNAFLWYGRVNKVIRGVTPKMLLIIDAGSSGTRMNAFQITWSTIHSHDPHPETVQLIGPEAALHKVPRHSVDGRRAYKRVETAPGLHTFSNTSSYPLMGKVALIPLLDWAKAVVPVKQWSSTPVFLLATAGMRKLPIADQEKILEEARKVLKSESHFLFEDAWARVLSGSDEGLYSWASLNYATKALTNTERESRVGSLDLGGSSLQVTFEVSNPMGKNGAEGWPAASNFSLLNRQFRMFTQSYSHYGLDDAFERSIVNLLEKSKPEVGAKNSLADQDDSAFSNFKPPVHLLVHPCLPKNYKEMYKRLSLFNQVPEPSSIILEGNPDKDACHELVRQLVVSSLPPLPQLPSDIVFVGISGFHVVNHFFGLQKGSITEIESKAGSFCRQAWEEVQEQHPDDLGSETYCFRAIYISYLLSQGLGLQPWQVKMDDGTASWTLGAALVEGSQCVMVSGYGIRSQSKSRYYSAAKILLCLALIVCIIAIICFITFPPRWALAYINGGTSFLRILQPKPQTRTTLSAFSTTGGSDLVGKKGTLCGVLPASGRSMSRSSTFSRRLYAQECGTTVTDR